MQIHEIFRRNTNEGVLKGIKTGVQKGAQAVGQAFQNAKPLAGAIASNLGGQILQKAGLPSSAGLKGDEAGFGNARAVAAKYNKPLIQQEAKNMMERWDLGVKQAMQRDRVSSPTQLSKNSIRELRRSLWNMLHSRVLQGRMGTSYKNLPNLVDPQAKSEATKLVTLLTDTFNNASDLHEPLPKFGDWLALANTANQAMALAQSRPASAVAHYDPRAEAKRQLEIDRLKQVYKASDNKDAIVAQMKQLGANPQELNSMVSSMVSPPAMSMGGDKLNPNDPLDAQILAAINKQGKV